MVADRVGNETTNGRHMSSITSTALKRRREHVQTSVGCNSVWSGLMCKKCHVTAGDGFDHEDSVFDDECKVGQTYTPEMASLSARILTATMSGVDPHVGDELARSGFFCVSTLKNDTWYQCFKCGYTITDITDMYHDCTITTYEQICRVNVFVLTRRMIIDRILCMKKTPPCLWDAHTSKVNRTYVKCATVSNESWTEQTECVVCYDGKPSIAFLSCGHKVVCERCNTRMITCPMCRVHIMSRVVCD
ncbi:iap-like protein-2 [Heliothis virescens ascovirus 3h]|uniref:Iap-like protein-2 n=1 Tax=Heliothis virescens ascovirus 3h TaxID=1268039 RepID=A0A2K8ES56_9VIRU|nr:iap-like protein-2 [Heliothis virescens ascovirus 3h]